MRRLRPALALAVLWAAAVQLAGAVPDPAGVYVTLVEAAALPPGAALRLYVETPDGRILEELFRPAPAAGAAAIPPPAMSLMERRRSDTAPPSPAMAGSDHAHSGSSREPVGAGPASAAPPPAAAPIRSLGALHVRVSTRTADAAPDAARRSSVFFAPLPEPVRGVPFEGSVVLELGSTLTSLRFHAP